jgi:hypothetical protein
VKKEIFLKYINKHVKIQLKPRNFVVYGYIRTVFEDCIEFETNQRTSYIDFDVVSMLTLADE